MTQPAVAVTPLLEADVAAFSSRAEAWIEARRAHRESARAQARELSTDARQAEQDRIAAEAAALAAEAERLRAAEIAARTTTTSTPPTTTAAPTTAPPAPIVTVAAGDDPPAPPTTVPSTTVAPTTVPDPGWPSFAQWEVLRQCESSGNYAIVSANGRYRGAYQFSQATWDWVAGWANPSLAGVDPASAAPTDQDAMALALWIRQGWSPWPICGAAAAA